MARWRSKQRGPKESPSPPHHFVWRSVTMSYFVCLVSVVGVGHAPRGVCSRHDVNPDPGVQSHSEPRPPLRTRNRRRCTPQSRSGWTTWALGRQHCLPRQHHRCHDGVTATRWPTRPRGRHQSLNRRPVQHAHSLGTLTWRLGKLRLQRAGVGTFGVSRPTNQNEN